MDSNNPRHCYQACNRCGRLWILPLALGQDVLRACPGCYSTSDLAAGPVFRVFSNSDGASDRRAEAPSTPPANHQSSGTDVRLATTSTRPEHSDHDARGACAEASPAPMNPPLHQEITKDFTDINRYSDLFPHGHIVLDSPAADRRSGQYAIQYSIRAMQGDVRVPFMCELSAIAQNLTGYRLGRQQLAAATSATPDQSVAALQRSHLGTANSLHSSTLSTAVSCYRPTAILKATHFSGEDLDIMLEVYGASLSTPITLSFGCVNSDNTVSVIRDNDGSTIVPMYQHAGCGWSGVRKRESELSEDADDSELSTDEEDGVTNPFRFRGYLPKVRDDSKCSSCFLERKKCDGQRPCSACQKRRFTCRDQDPATTEQILDAAHKPRKFDPHSRRARTSPCVRCFRARISCDEESPCGNCTAAGVADSCTWEHKVKDKSPPTLPMGSDQLASLAVSLEQLYCSGCGWISRSTHPHRHSSIKNHRYQYVCDRCFTEETKTGQHSSKSPDRECWFCRKKNTDGESFTVALVQGDEGHVWCPDCRRLHRQIMSSSPSPLPSSVHAPIQRAGETDIKTRAGVGMEVVIRANSSPPVKATGSTSDEAASTVGEKDAKVCCACGSGQSSRWKIPHLPVREHDRWCRACHRFWKKEQLDPAFSPAAILSRTGEAVLCAGRCGNSYAKGAKFSVSKLDRTKFWCVGCTNYYHRTGQLDPALRDERECDVCKGWSVNFYKSRAEDESGKIWCHNCYIYWRDHDEHPQNRRLHGQVQDRQRMLAIDSEGSLSDYGDDDDPIDDAISVEGGQGAK